MAIASELEPNNDFNHANVVTLDSAGFASIPSKISPLRDVDYFKFVTPTFSGRGNISFSMRPTSDDHALDARIQIFDSFGGLITEQDFGFDNVNETIAIRDFIGQRTYYVVCRSADFFDSGSGNYSLEISFSVTPGLFGQMLRQGDPTAHPVHLVTFAPDKVINSQKMTWIVIHGWNSSPDQGSMPAAFKALSKSRPEDQVLALDWSSAANTGLLNPFSAENAIVPVAEWAAGALANHGFSGTNLNLVGHSFGSYVADEIAQRIPGGVNTLITLDPALDIPGGYSPLEHGRVNFARNSNFSWSLHSSALGDALLPTTADESFLIQSGLNSISAHSIAVSVFAFMVLNPGNSIPGFLLLTSLLEASPGPWLPDQFSSSSVGGDNIKGYEAVIHTTPEGEPFKLEYVPLPSILIFKNTQGIKVFWPRSYDTFRLEHSPDNNPASWTTIEGIPESDGAANFFLFSGTDTSAGFFRLKNH